MRFELCALASLAWAFSACGQCNTPKKFHDEELYKARRAWLEEQERLEKQRQLCGSVPDAPSCAEAKLAPACDAESNDGACKKPPEARPRCEASDPSCGPDPNALYEGCYDPSRGRTPAWKEALAQPPNCEHDGECVDTGCGSSCSSYRALHEESLRRPRVASYCHLPEKFDRNDLLCGCVENRCMFFTQPPYLRK